MIDDLPRGKRVKRNRVALGPAAGGNGRIDCRQTFEGLVEMPCPEQRRCLASAGTRGMAVAPDRMTPRDDVARVVEIGFDVDHHRRTKRGPRELIDARPLHAHGAAIGSEREPRCVERDVIGSVVTVAAGALHMLDDDLILRDA